MNVTNNLKLPQYTEEDIFDLQDINKAYDSIDKAYKEVIDFKNEIPKTNATAEVIDARGGKETLGERLNEFDEQLEHIVKHTDNNVINLNIFNPIGDGLSHPLSERFLTLEEAQIIYPCATNLNDEIDWCALQTALDLANTKKCIIQLDLKTYVINKELNIYNGSAIKGEPFSVKVGNFGEVGATTSKYHGKHSIIQYNSGVSGSIFNVKDKSDFVVSYVHFRNCDKNVSANYVINDGIAFLKMTDCIIECMRSVNRKESTDTTTLGDCFINNNVIIGCSIGFKNTIYDCFFTNNRFVSTQNPIYCQAGSGANQIIGNRFEWGTNGIILEGATTQTITSNFFDANYNSGINILDGTNGCTISNNIFNRNGNKNTGNLSCHIFIRNKCLNNLITGNVFRKATGDFGGDILGPKYIITIEGGADNSNIIFNSNSTYGGYTDKPINNMYGGVKVLNIDFIDIENGKDITTITRESTSFGAVDTITYNIYENKTCSDYCGNWDINFRGIGSGITITNSNGILQFKKLYNIIHCGTKFDKDGKIDKIPTSGQIKVGTVFYYSDVATNKALACVCSASGDPGDFTKIGTF